MPARLSLKRRLLLWALAATIAVWLVTALLTYYNTRKEVNALLDVHLTQVAAILAAQSQHELEEIIADDAPMLMDDSVNVAFQVWEDGQRLRLHSANVPEYPLTKRDHGFSDTMINGQKWRVFSVWDNTHRMLIHVAEPADMRERLGSTIAYNLLLPLLFSLPLLALLLWFAVTRGLRPLVKLTREVARREPDNLVPLNAGAAPREVVPLIEHLNRLFGRIDFSLQKERRFTADAAHELRTPVAAIKAQAQVARAAYGETERVHALDNAILGCDRAAHLIDQLLTLARLDALDDSAAERCRLREIASEVIAAIAPAALEKGAQIELLDGDEVVVRGNPGLLRILLRNLIDNAVCHTPSGTLVQINIADEHGEICLSVSDNGFGIPEPEREKVMERFYRSLGTQASGSGLGLSIVKRIAEIHTAILRIVSPDVGNGLRVEVIFKKCES